MDESQLEGKLKELVREFGGAADSRYKKLMMFGEQSGKGKENSKKNVDTLQESLDYLRICIKYQIFDLEATRRENEYLKKILGENNGRGPS